MASTNGITGDSLVNKPNSKEYEENYDKIFGKKDKTQDPITKPFPHNILRQSRIDVIGQNGNDGDHYEYELNKSTGEVEKRFKEGFEKPNGDQFGD
jgi:hypothetical protein